MTVGDSIPVLAVLVGQPQVFGPEGQPSTYFRRPVEGRVAVGRLGIEGDQPADLAVHGGVDKALHHYPHDHYARFVAERPEHAGVFDYGYGVFAENVAAAGWTERDVCIGDRFLLGMVEVELSQGRSPCWKLGHRFRDPSMVDAVVRTRRTGWYYRVLRPGRFGAGDSLTLVARPYPEWPVARAFGVLVAGDDDPDGAAELAAMPELGAAWRKRAEGRVAAARRGAG
ncbi:MAG: MOSC domain-containing protein [Bauldia sp.]